MRTATFEPPRLEIGARFRFVGQHTLDAAFFGLPCEVDDIYDEAHGWPMTYEKDGKTHKATDGASYDCAVRFETGARTMCFAESLLELDSPRWPFVPAGPSCPIANLIVDASDRVVPAPPSEYWQRIDRQHASDNDVWFHAIAVNGRVFGQPSYSKRHLYSSGAEIPAEVVAPRTNLPLDADRVAALLRALGATSEQIDTLIPERQAA